MILQGDCLELIKNVEDQSIDLILFDPPYATTTSDWDKELDWPTLWKELKRTGKPTTPILIFSQQPFTSYLVMSNLKDFKYEIIWQKEKGVNFITAKNA